MFNIQQYPYKTVCIEGNISSGKSTFLNHFRDLEDTGIINEPVEKWCDVAGINLLELAYKDPKRYSYELQTYIQLIMLDNHTSKIPQAIKIMERSVHSGKCFTEILRRKNILSNTEVLILDEWYNWYLKNTNVYTDAIIYLRTTPEVAYGRMKRRGRKEENDISFEYLKEIHQIHEDWLYHQCWRPVPAPVIIVNGDRDPSGMMEEFEKCKKIIYKGQTNDTNNGAAAAASSAFNGFRELPTKKEELRYMPKRYLLKYHANDINFLWDKLPPHIKNDPEVQDYLYCFLHYNQPGQRDHIDGPPPRVKDCMECKKKKIYGLIM